MGARVDSYREALRQVEDLEGYLADHSGLPGPRGNLELARAAAEELDRAVLERLARSEDEFEAFYGVVGLGRAIAEGRADLVPALRAHANDRRWRVREGVAMALQRWGDDAVTAMLDEVAWIVRENLGKARLQKVLAGPARGPARWPPRRRSAGCWRSFRRTGRPAGGQGRCGSRGRPGPLRARRPRRQARPRP